jgi:transcriptional regulator with XRE-family HTH domain
MKFHCPFNIQLKASKPNRKPYPKELITYGDHLRKKRLDLNLSQPQVAQMLNVTPDSIINWELNRNTPDLSYIPKIISFLGYTPETSLNPIKQYRIEKGLSQKEMARMLKLTQQHCRGLREEKEVGLIKGLKRDWILYY